MVNISNITVKMVYGLKDEINDEIYINSATNNKDKFLKNVFITKFDKNFDLIENIFQKKLI